MLLSQSIHQSIPKLSQLIQAGDRQAYFAELHQAIGRVLPADLFTVMRVDEPNQLTQRLYSSDLLHYPLAGEKPLHPDAWYQRVIVEQQSFVANSIDEMAPFFPDTDLIAQLGLGSVINLPVVMAGKCVASVNVLAKTGQYQQFGELDLSADLAWWVLPCLPSGLNW